VIYFNIIQVRSFCIKICLKQEFSFILASNNIFAKITAMAEKIEHLTPYENKENSKKSQVKKMFNNIAPYYDFLNHILSLGIDIRWRKKAIKSLKPHREKFSTYSILDVATGTADLAIETIKQLDPDKVVGLDIAEDMLAVGRKKISKRKLDSKIELIAGDSEALPFESNQFNAVVAAFGVRNFENLEKGLEEMFRVLKPGGQLMVLEFSKPSSFPFKQVFQLYFKYVLPVIGRVKSKDPKAYRYLYESVQLFPDYDNFVAVLQKLGFQESKWKALSLGICCIYSARK
jgi:demethylmenaquinone methyltransferase/2-methoxy-6-polyprenyl-1,4-benzoquinol methylase